ncbi:uncharacterized protein LOC110820888 [Carica papaya]|uniref:uncharacterized protein LOC110820888 n=1 Tax=Carica papaya TaxID=3649 RepID=UPI000B8C708E|nr:uncharacterized protein LOC110820888 [Carica papaya]
MSSATSKKKGTPQIVTLDKALKLAEQWVNSMTSAEDEPTSVESEGRPPRLGLGAKVSRQFKFRPSNDPVERKLHAKLDSRKRKAAKYTEESSPAARDECLDDDVDEEDLESRSSVFAKRRADRKASSLQTNNKQKK